MFGRMKEELARALEQLERDGLYKAERVLLDPQGRFVHVLPEGGRGRGRKVLNFCANNYLGLSNHPEVVRAAQEALGDWGYGLSSVRFICGTQEPHRRLERRLAEFLRCEDALMYSSCFDANGGLFEPLLDERDAVISDQLNHASIIDGVRLCKAERLRYKHADSADLERCLIEAAGRRYRLISTDGVFSMDGDVAPLRDICDLAEKHDALVMVDDSHATGYLGDQGRGTPELCGVEGRVDLINTTFGKALGGASGGCTAGRAEVIAWLRQRSRPYLFSNSLAPAVVAGTLKALDLVQDSPELRQKVLENAAWFRDAITARGFEVAPGSTAIVPVMLHEETLALRMADALLEQGIYVVGFAFPVVPRGRARIRVQLSAVHERSDLEAAVTAFAGVGRALGVV